MSHIYTHAHILSVESPPLKSLSLSPRVVKSQPASPRVQRPPRSERVIARVARASREENELWIARAARESNHARGARRTSRLIQSAGVNPRRQVCGSIGCTGSYIVCTHTVWFRSIEEEDEDIRIYSESAGETWSRWYDSLLLSQCVCVCVLFLSL